MVYGDGLIHGINRLETIVGGLPFVLFMLLSHCQAYEIYIDEDEWLVSVIGQHSYGLIWYWLGID